MFGKLGKFMESASKLVTGKASNPVDEFTTLWSEINDFFTRPHDEDVPVKETSLPWRLERMLNVLVKEQERMAEAGAAANESEDASASDSSSRSSNSKRRRRPKASIAAGPCMEEFIEKRMLQTLYSFAKANYPYGMHALVLDFTAELLSNSQTSLIPHVGIHAPLNKLIDASLASRDARYFTSFLKLLRAVCKVLVRDPSLIQFMIVETADSPPTMPVLVGLGYSMNVEVEQSSDARARMGTMARSAILALLTTPSGRLRSAVLAADLPESMVKALGALFAALPPAESAADASANPLRTALQDQAEFVGNVARLGGGSIARAAANAITASFLGPILGPALEATIDNQAETAMRNAAVVVRALGHPALVDALGAFLFGPGAPLRSTLINRVEAMSDAVALAALDLFVALLSGYSGCVLEHLVLCELRPASDLLAPLHERTGGSHNALEAFLALGVVHNPSSQPRLDYEGYLLDAHARLAACLQAYTLSREQATELVVAAPPAEGGPPEGAFLAVIFNRLEALLESPLEINLAVTHIVSLLAVYPSELLHAVLLNPSPLRAGADMRTLYAILAQVADEIAGRSRRQNDFAAKLDAAKRSLGMDTARGAGAEAEARKLDTFETFGREDFLHGVLVFEEFCKDLAGVLLAKAPLAAAPPPTAPACDPLAAELLAAVLEADEAEEEAASTPLT
ncbi:uncharacterized protein AMSG_05979 [Thecamonas trahens ATCC 50062]|uniref:FHF complex subunit HOOK-interacting protein C-terminal domain-containing protein n=1 Tax=Thecamonas trahens ATCC 50062 TaxID=461836 RepID=A0A0L0DBJ8_THETB|nr:hypothetical protein AMSG_05979 [Thecamonas trahens ATCC 50062]KNC49712.1 hypothetical protein AMSG_05979 [Thecamonas trahens ATCC 50062]|eukprot:XP_013757503.1 hypothetical protein AMSG_05979 [Thecamonas trahens ATCC 50062]